MTDSAHRTTTGPQGIDWDQVCVRCSHSLRSHSTPGTECIYTDNDGDDEAWCDCGRFISLEESLRRNA